MNKQENLNILLDASFSRGCDSLSKDSWVRPFALFMDQQGNLVFSENLTEKQLEEDPEILLSDLNVMLHKKAIAGEVLGCSVVSQVKFQNPGNGEMQTAIEAYIDYSDGSSYDCFLPFTLNDEGQPQLGEIICKEETSKKFTNSK